MKALIIFAIIVFLISSFLKITKGKKSDTVDDDSKINAEESDDMTPEDRLEKFETKRRNFKQNTLTFFKFLVEEFGYSTPEYKFTQQPNGFVTKDEFRYVSEKFDRLIVVENGYHPYDYGFDVTMYRPSVSTAYSDDANIRFVAVRVEKESQDLEQNYIENLAKDFKKDFVAQIKGQVWREK